MKQSVVAFLGFAVSRLYQWYSYVGNEGYRTNLISVYFQCFTYFYNVAYTVSHTTKKMANKASNNTATIVSNYKVFTTVTVCIVPYSQLEHLHYGHLH